jgi:pre-mRNA-splicing factor ATP-dependent RNA helicase DHX15/PRP43
VAFARPSYLTFFFFAISSSVFRRIYLSTLSPLTSTMTDNRSDSEGGSRAKRQKMDAGDPKNNPYLAHMYENGNGNGSESTVLSKFKRHQTTAAMARKAEDGDINPFTGRPFSTKYFSILKTRRELPVQQQR